MNDNDYIRKGVELAAKSGIAHWQELNQFLHQFPLEEAHDNEQNRQCELDALAAQLVRQVDATSKSVWPELIVYHNVTKIHDGSVMKWVVDGSNRTMNTIKAIVDSKVLEA